jgi:hypothetical protein
MIIDSLSPFHMPRKSGIAVCATAAGLIVSVASIKVQIKVQANFDMV